MSLTSLSSLSDEEEITQRQFRERVDLFSQCDDEEFREKYRISKETVLKIRNIVDLEPVTQRNKSIDGLTQLLITLRFFATGSFLQVISDVDCLHKSSVCRVVQRVSCALAKLSQKYIKMPVGNELQQIGDSFFEIDGFPRVAGVLGCTHVKIITRCGLSEQYRSSAGYLSIKTHVICDVALRIRDIIARWPGSVADNTIFNNSHLCADLQMGTYANYHLLGDSAYKNTNYLLTPSHALTNAEAAYNKSHSATRGVIDRFFRTWKQRFPCLERGVKMNKISNVLEVIVACAVLHNMCLDLDEPPLPKDVDFECDNFSHSEILNNEVSVRSNLVKTFFS